MNIWRLVILYLMCVGLSVLSVRAKDVNPVTLMLPSEGSVVPVLTAGQREFFGMSDEERRKPQGDALTRAKWLSLGWYPQPVVFVWDGIQTRKCDVRFRIWREADNVCICDTNFLYLTTSRFEWDNFRVGTAYRWGLDVKGQTTGSTRAHFTTDDTPPRIIRVQGVPNVRDLGGWRTRSGRRVRQGLLYRTANLCENSGECRERPPRTRMTPETCYFMTNALGIRTELDLRGPRECEGLVVSPLGSSVRRVELSSGCYGAMSGEKEKEACLAALRLMAGGESLPLIFHCSSGQDRTGTLAFIVNGLLGVSPDDLARDWDASMLWNNNSGWLNRNFSYAALIKLMDAYPGETLNDRIVAYVKSIGFLDKEIACLRDLLLE